MTTEISVIEYVGLGLYPQEEGCMEVTLEYDLPPDLESLTVSLPSDATPLFDDGFDGSGRYSWDGSTLDPKITFVVPVDSDSSRFSGYSFVDKGHWAITQVPSISTRVAAPPDTVVDRDRRFVVDGDGVVSQDGYMVFLGQNRSTTVSGHNETVRFVDPDVAELRPPTVSVLESLSAASEALRIGARSPEVVALAAPDGEADWGLTAGLQSGDCGFWTRDTQSVATPHNTWVHEYVHTRQDFGVTESTKWLVEGSANYYAALLSFVQGVTPYERFHSTVSTSKDETATLADPQTWPSPFTDYKKGMRVLAALDVEIRERTGGDRALQDLFRELNARPGTVSLPDVKSNLESIATGSMDGWVDRFVRSPDCPPVPRKPDLYEREAIVPIDGPQPVCPECGTDADGTYCDGCGLALDQRCEGCSSPVLGTETFCPACGRNMERTCGSCGTKVGDSRYCPGCGAEVET